VISTTDLSFSLAKYFPTHYEVSSEIVVAINSFSRTIMSTS